MNPQIQQNHGAGFKQELQNSPVCSALSQCAAMGNTGIELAPWLKYLLFKCCYRRFQLQIPTTELMSAARSLQEKMVIAIVAMMDVDATSLRRGLNASEWSVVEACHGYLQQIEWRH